MKGCRVDFGMAVVLRREELILRREWTVDLADVDDSPVGRRYRGEVLRDVGEGYESFALCEDRERPFRNAQNAQSRGREASPEDVPTGALLCHVGSFPWTPRCIAGVRDR